MEGVIDGELVDLDQSFRTQLFRGLVAYWALLVWRACFSLLTLSAR